MCNVLASDGDGAGEWVVREAGRVGREGAGVITDVSGGGTQYGTHDSALVWL